MTIPVYYLPNFIIKPKRYIVLPCLTNKEKSPERITQNQNEVLVPNLPDSKHTTLGYFHSNDLKAKLNNTGRQCIYKIDSFSHGSCSTSFHFSVLVSYPKKQFFFNSCRTLLLLRKNVCVCILIFSLLLFHRWVSALILLTTGLTVWEHSVLCEQLIISFPGKLPTMTSQKPSTLLSFIPTLFLFFFFFAICLPYILVLLPLIST